MVGVGVLLPRDFLERQPKRWQKSQRKRGAIRALSQMRNKREKLEQKALRHAHSDAQALLAARGAMRSSPRVSVVT
eukprot:6181172-Pleurochrysis_carterae.AAC.1